MMISDKGFLNLVAFSFQRNPYIAVYSQDSMNNGKTKSYLAILPANQLQLVIGKMPLFNVNNHDKMGYYVFYVQSSLRERLEFAGLKGTIRLVFFIASFER